MGLGSVVVRGAAVERDVGIRGSEIRGRHLFCLILSAPVWSIPTSSRTF